MNLLPQTSMVKYVNISEQYKMWSDLYFNLSGDSHSTLTPPPVEVCNVGQKLCSGLTVWMDVVVIVVPEIGQKLS